MKAALISLGSVSSQLTIEALKKHFKTVEQVDIQELEVSLGQKKAQILYKGEPLPKYDCIYAKGSYRYSTLLRAITALLQKECYMPLKPSSFTIGHDKLLTHLKLQENNVPQPATFIASTAETGKKILKKITFPIVMKLPSGTHGKGVMIADSPESASSMIDALALLKQPFLIQEYIETGGSDYRAIVVGGNVVAAMKRIAGEGEKRANLHSGGRGEKIELDEKAQKIAIAAAKATGCSICGVDLLFSHKGPVVLEVNVSPGFQGITNITRINVSEIVADFLHKKTKEFREQGREEIFKELEAEQEIHGTPDFRGNRILLPEVLSMASKIKETDEVVMKAKKGEIVVSKA